MYKKAIDIIIGMIITIIALLFIWGASCIRAQAQNVTLQGNTFVQVDSSSNKIKKDNPLLTKYFYQTVDGTKYSIYMSASGKCFILRISKNGKRYKQYLPEISKQLKSQKK